MSTFLLWGKSSRFGDVYSLVCFCRGEWWDGIRVVRKEYEGV